MVLTVREVARLLGTPEKRVYQWVDEGEMPAHRVNEQLRFNRAELLEWATALRLPISADLFRDEDDVAPDRLSLAQAIEAGGIYDHLSASDIPSALRAVVAHMPVPSDGDREFLLEVMLAREARGSTGVGDGIAIPHVRSPVVLDGAQAAITICFFDKGIDFGAVDEKPVHTLFAIESPTINGHLQILAKLSWALHDPGFRQAILRRAPREEILAEVRRTEASIPKPAGSGS